MAERSIWLGGRDAFLEDLALRDAERRLNEDRAFARSEAERRGTMAERQIRVQEQGLESLEKDRTERRADVDAARKIREDEAAAAKARSAALAALLDAYDNAPDEATKKSVGLRIINSGGQLPPRDPSESGFTLSPGGRRYDKDGKLIASAPDRPRADPNATVARKDDPTLPRGVREWIDGMLQQGLTNEQVQSNLAKHWGDAKKAHPDLDPKKMMGYLDEARTVKPEPPPKAPGEPLDDAAIDKKLSDYYLSLNYDPSDMPGIIAETKKQVAAGNPEAIAIARQLGVPIPAPRRVAPFLNGK